MTTFYCRNFLILYIDSLTTGNVFTKLQYGCGNIHWNVHLLVQWIFNKRADSEWNTLAFLSSLIADCCIGHWRFFFQYCYIFCVHSPFIDFDFCVLCWRLLSMMYNRDCFMQQEPWSTSEYLFSISILKVLTAIHKQWLPVGPSTRPAPWPTTQLNPGQFNTDPCAENTLQDKKSWGQLDTDPSHTLPSGCAGQVSD